MSQVHHCHPGLNNAASRMGHGRDRCLFTQRTLTVSQLTHENSHLQSARTFSDNACTAQSTRKGSLDPSFSRTRTSASTQSTRCDLRTAHVRGEMKHENSHCSSTRTDQARTAHCVREETKRLRTAPSARTKQEDRFAPLNVRGHKLVLGRIYQAGSVR